MGVLQKLVKMDPTLLMDRKPVVFVDPGSKSAGYAVFTVDGKMIEHGTCTAKGSINKRLRIMNLMFKDVAKRHDPGLVIIERMNYKVHYYLHWVVGVLVTCMGNNYDFQSPSEWKKHLKLHLLTLDVVEKLFDCESIDEAVAISMGFTHFKKKLIHEDGNFL